MSNMYSITDVSPTLGGNVLIEISFKITVSDDIGNTVAEDVIDIGSYPPPASEDGYTEEELIAICGEIAGERNIYVHLDNLIGIKQTPVYIPSPPPVLSDDEKKTLWMAQVDVNVASVYNQFTRFQMEYEAREAAALAFKNAGYSGDPTVWVTSFADSAGLSYQIAADVVLSQANNLRAALSSLAELRMDKYRIKNSTTIAEAEQEFNLIVNSVAAIARELA